MSSEDVKQAVMEVLLEFHESDGFCPRCFQNLKTSSRRQTITD